MCSQQLRGDNVSRTNKSPWPCHRITVACNCRGAGSSKTIFGQPRSIVAAAAEQRLLLPLREGRMCSVAVVVSGGGCDDGGGRWLRVCCLLGGGCGGLVSTAFLVPLKCSLP